VKNINTFIAKAFNNFGYEVVVNENAVFFEPIGLEITGIVQEENTVEEEANYKTFIKVVLNCKSRTSKSIYEFTYGWGETKGKSIIMGFERWLESDFPVIHDWLANHKIDDYCEEIKIRSIVLETKEMLYFGGILGPLSHYKSGETFFDKENQTELYRELNNALTTDFLDKKGIYPIKCFVVSDENKNIQIDCRVNGENWERGHQTLYNYCEKKWNVDTHTFWKQYFLIYDYNEGKREFDQIIPERLLAGRKNKTGFKKWWEFWK